MLHIKQKFHISVPHLNVPHKLQFSRVEPEDDELIEAIGAETLVHDDDWQLEERPDTKELSQYWSKVEDDIRHDPKWISIAENDNT